jgi:hypothetical protein
MDQDLTEVHGSPIWPCFCNFYRCSVSRKAPRVKMAAVSDASCQSDSECTRRMSKTIYASYQKGCSQASARSYLPACYDGEAQSATGDARTSAYSHTTRRGERRRPHIQQFTALVGEPYGSDEHILLLESTPGPGKRLFTGNPRMHLGLQSIWLVASMS